MHQTQAYKEAGQGPASGEETSYEESAPGVSSSAVGMERGRDWGKYRVKKGGGSSVNGSLHASVSLCQHRMRIGPLERGRHWRGTRKRSSGGGGGGRTDRLARLGGSRGLGER